VLKQTILLRHGVSFLLYILLIQLNVHTDITDLTIVLFNRCWKNKDVQLKKQSYEMVRCINELFYNICDKFQTSQTKEVVRYCMESEEYSLDATSTEHSLRDAANDLADNYLCGCVKLKSEMADKLVEAGFEIKKKQEKAEAVDDNNSADHEEELAQGEETLGSEDWEGNDDEDIKDDFFEKKKNCHQTLFLKFCGVSSCTSSDLACGGPSTFVVCGENEKVIDTQLTKDWSIKWELRTCGPDTVIASLHVIYFNYLSEEEKVVFGGVMPRLKIIFDLLLAKKASSFTAKTLWLRYFYKDEIAKNGVDRDFVDLLNTLSLENTNRDTVYNYILGNVDWWRFCINPECTKEKKSKNKTHTRYNPLVSATCGKTLSENLQLSLMLRKKSKKCNNCKKKLAHAANFERFSKFCIILNGSPKVLCKEEQSDFIEKVLCSTFYHNKHGPVHYQVVFIAYSNSLSCTQQPQAMHFIGVFLVDGKFYSYDGIENNGFPTVENFEFFPSELTKHRTVYLPSFFVYMRNSSKKLEPKTTAVSKSLSSETSTNAIEEDLFVLMASKIDAGAIDLKKNLKMAIGNEDKGIEEQLTRLFASHPEPYYEIAKKIQSFIDNSCQECEYDMCAAYTCILLGYLCGISIHVESSHILHPIRENGYDIYLKATVRGFITVNTSSRDISSKKCANLENNEGEALWDNGVVRYDFSNCNVIVLEPTYLNKKSGCPVVIISDTESEVAASGDADPVSSSDQQKEQHSSSSCHQDDFKMEMSNTTASPTLPEPKQQPHQRSAKEVHGLSGTKNTCFLLAALQLILCCDEVRIFLKDKSKWTSNTWSNYGDEKCNKENDEFVLEELAAISNLMYSTAELSVIKTNFFLKKCQDAKPNLFKKRKQDDASQAFCFLQTLLFHFGLDRKLFRCKDPDFILRCGTCNTE
jgi:hypothetical protein